MNNSQAALDLTGNTLDKAGEGVSETLSNLLLGAAQNMGIDLAQLFKHAPFPYVVNHKGGILLPQVTPEQFTPIYRKCMGVLMRRIYGQTGRPAPTVEDYKLFCYCTINCADLNEVIARATAFCNALNGRVGRLQLSCEGQRAVLSIDTRLQSDTHAALVCDLLRLHFFHKFFSWLIGEPLPLIQASLAHRPQFDQGSAKALLGCQVYFNGLRNTLVFNRDLLRRPIERTYNELIEVLAKTAIELVPLPTAVRLSTHLENFFRKALLEEKPIPTADRLAHLLGQSGPTLRRHLAQESTSFQHIMDQCRIDRALQLLSQPKLTIDEIAYSLGFSAPSGFSRAFKDWTGYPPSEYRKRLLAPQN